MIRQVKNKPPGQTNFFRRENKGEERDEETQTFCCKHLSQFTDALLQLSLTILTVFVHTLGLYLLTIISTTVLMIEEIMANY